MYEEALGDGESRKVHLKKKCPYKILYGDYVFNFFSKKE